MLNMNFEPLRFVLYVVAGAYLLGWYFKSDQIKKTALIIAGGACFIWLVLVLCVYFGR